MHGKSYQLKLSRRTFLANISLMPAIPLATDFISGVLENGNSKAGIGRSGNNETPSVSKGENQNSYYDTRNLDMAIDFRNSPLSWQTAYCFPDDPYKSLVGERGELRYGHPGRGYGIFYFPLIVEFSANGMERDTV